MFRPIYSESGRIFGLDVVRCKAILLVLVDHCLGFGDHSAFIEVIQNLSGIIGVELFFSLSGFLIGGILLSTLLKNDQFSRPVLINFWERRWYRTLPLFWAMLSIYTLCSLLFWDQTITTKFAGQLIGILLFVQNILTPHPGFFRVAWSLAIEEWSYLILPCLLILLVSATRVNSKKAVFLGAVSSLIMIGFLMRIIIAFVMNTPSLIAQLPGQNVLPQFVLGTRKMLLFRLDAIAYGALLAYCWRFKLDWIKSNGFALRWLSAGCLVIALYMTIVHFMSISSNPFFIIFCFPLYGIGFSLLLITAIEIERPAAMDTVVRFIEYISITSYSIYLVHDVLWNFFKRYYLFGSAVSHSLGIVVFLGLTYILSVQTYNYIERPFLVLRDHKKISAHVAVKMEV